MALVLNQKRLREGKGSQLSLTVCLPSAHLSLKTPSFASNSSDLFLLIIGHPWAEKQRPGSPLQQAALTEPAALTAFTLQQQASTAGSPSISSPQAGSWGACSASSPPRNQGYLASSGLEENHVFMEQLPFLPSTSLL